MSGMSSHRILEKKEVILSLWEERSLKEVPAAVTGARLALRNSIPLYLDHLSEALATNRRMDFKSVFAHDQEASRIGKLHGADRADNRSYILTEVIFEYHILREVIFQVLETEELLPQIQRDIILDSVEQAVNDAAVKFSEVHADIQQKFINTLTHDLKNPLTAAKMNAEMILRRSDLPPDYNKPVNRIIGNLNRLHAMIHDLLDASRIRAGEQLSILFTDDDLEQVIRGVLDEMSIIHGDRFVLDSKESLQGNWGCDGIRRAVENLIENGIKYGALETPITVSLKKEGKALEIGVHNQGPAISKTEIPHLFEQYRRSKSAQAGSKPGWGLGLTLVRGVVDAHKGKVRVESEDGKGTSFILEIPIIERSITQAV